MSETVRVELGARAYDVTMGADLDHGALVRAQLKRPWTVIVTDENVAARHLVPLTAALDAVGVWHAAIILPPGEQTKSFATLGPLVERLLDHGVERSDAIIALGGGVIGDLTGFAAAILKRGCAFIQMPTTLLAQVDSSVGGKTAIDSRHGKNLIGAFHQPRAVLADMAWLETLPRREILAGYAEIAKYGLLGDASFFTWLERNGAAVVAGDPAARLRAVAHSVRMKARIVVADETEQGERALLNLGHTFGHALETATGHGSSLLHGEAVAIGCVLAFELSARLGLCDPADAARVRAHFAALGLPVRPPAGLDAPALWAHMQHDKKAAAGKVAFVLARGIGQAFVQRDVAAEAVLATLDDALEAAA